MFSGHIMPLRHFPITPGLVQRIQVCMELSYGEAGVGQDISLRRRPSPGKCPAAGGGRRGRRPHTASSPYTKGDTNQKMEFLALHWTAGRALMKQQIGPIRREWRPVLSAGVSMKRRRADRLLPVPSTGQSEAWIDENAIELEQLPLIAGLRPSCGLYEPEHMRSTHLAQRN